MGLFFNVRKPRKFHHEPIFFDPRKEELEERINKVKKEMGMADDKEYKPAIKGTLVDQTSHLKRRRLSSDKSNSSRNIKLAVALVLLLIILYYFYFRG